MVFTISQTSIEKRRRNILWGGILSLMLAGMIVLGHYRQPETYNDVLLWSVLGFVVIANLVNYYRHRRYLRQVRDHRIEVLPGRVQFRTGGETSELEMRDIAALYLFRRKGVLQHIQVRLKTGRGIRLEGYGDLDRLAALLAEQIPPQHVVERRM